MDTTERHERKIHALTHALREIIVALLPLLDEKQRFQLTAEISKKAHGFSMTPDDDPYQQIFQELEEVLL